MERGEFNLLNDNFDIEKCIKAAENENPEAQESLAQCYHFGLFGLEKNEKKEFQLYSKSAKQGVPEAIDHLGDCYRYGIGTEIDEKKAFECYKKAAKGDYTDAICDLGDCYINGIGIEKDEQKGKELLEEAVDRDSENAINVLAEYYLENDNGEEAVKLYKKGKKLGDAKCQTMLGRCYLEGVGTVADENKAFKLIQEAAVKFDYHMALYWLGWFYANGVVVGKDQEMAELYYQKAVDNGYVEPKSNTKTLEDYYNENDNSEIEFSKTGAINYKNDKEKVQSCIVFIENHREDVVKALVILSAQMAILPPANMLSEMQKNYSLKSLVRIIKRKYSRERLSKQIQKPIQP